MYDERLKGVLGNVKNVLKVVIEDYDIVCIQAGKGVLTQNNEVNLYFMRDVNIDTGQNTYTLMGCSCIK